MLSININNNVVNLSVTLQLPFDDCPTVAAADVDSVVCLRNYCQFTDDYDKGELWWFLQLPLNTSLAVIVSLLLG